MIHTAAGTSVVCIKALLNIEIYRYTTFTKIEITAVLMQNNVYEWQFAFPLYNVISSAKHNPNPVNQYFFDSGHVTRLTKWRPP